MIKAVVFDWDGLLFDSEGCWLEADKRMLAQNNIKYDGGERYLFTGKSQADCANTFINKFGLKLPVGKIIDQRKEQVGKIYQVTEQQLMPGALALIKGLHQKGLKLAVASGSGKSVLDFIIKKQGLYSYFQEVISSDSVKNGKPAPDVYLHAAELLQIKASECVAFEDAESGVRSAKAAGMKCIAVPNKYTANQDFSIADRILKSLESISAEEVANGND
jgi:HAD superfamily hydrolase (TIGR01509 family)